MTSICLSVASNLRCSSLTLPQSNALLILPIADLVLCAVLLKARWGQLKKYQWTLIAESIAYFLLVLFDYLERRAARRGIDPSVYEVFDKIIGAITIFPLFLYLITLLLLARADILPLASSNAVRRFVQIWLVVTILPALIFNELASLLGVTYRIMNGQLFQGYVSTQARDVSTFLGSVTLILLAAFQFLVALSTLFYIYRARSLGHGGGVIPGFTSLGTGLVLGTVDTLLGFGPTTFELIIARRVLKALARGFIILGMIFGTSVDEGFALFPKPVSRPMTEIRTSVRDLRRLISGPRNSTFVQMSPSATTFHAGLARSQSQPRRPAYNRHNSSTSSQSFLVDRSMAPIENLASREGPPPSLPSSVSLRFFPSKRRQSNLTPTAKKGFNPFQPSDLASFPSRANRPGDRVTIHFPGDDYTKPPKLEIRLSDLSIPSVGAVIASIRTPPQSTLALPPMRRHTAYDEESGMAPPRRGSLNRRFQYPADRSASGNGSSGDSSDAKSRMKEFASRLPSFPSNARLSRGFSNLTRGPPPGKWAQLPDTESSRRIERSQTAFVQERPPATPLPVKRFSEPESIWLKTGSPPLRERDSSMLQPPAREGRWSDLSEGSRYEDDASDSYSTPGSARIVEARAVDVRPHWSTMYSLQNRSGPMQQESPTSVYTPDTAAMFGFGGRASPGRRFERELKGQGGAGSGTRQIFVSERRVSRDVLGSPGPSGPSMPTLRPEGSFARPRIAPRAVELERRRSEPDQQPPPSPEPSLPHHFRDAKSIDLMSTELGHSQDSIEAPSEFIGLRQVISRTPTVTASLGDRDSMAPEHGHALPTQDEFYGQYRISDSEEYPEEVPNTAGLSRQDSGVLTFEDRDLVTASARASWRSQVDRARYTSDSASGR